MEDLIFDICVLVPIQGKRILIKERSNKGQHFFSSYRVLSKKEQTQKEFLFRNIWSFILYHTGTHLYHTSLSSKKKHKRSHFTEYKLSIPIGLFFCLWPMEVEDDDTSSDDCIRKLVIHLVIEKKECKIQRDSWGIPFFIRYRKKIFLCYIRLFLFHSRRWIDLIAHILLLILFII